MGLLSRKVRRVLIAADLAQPEVGEFLPQLERACEARALGAATWICFAAGDGPAQPPPPLEGTDVVVVIGGDGTLMHTIRSLAYPRVPFYGVNYGQVGFLMNPRMEAPVLVSLLAGAPLSVVAYPVLEADLTLEDGTTRHELAFNDFVLERASGQTVHLQVHIDGVLLNRYSGDGLVVATPGGSGAYSLAAGGPMVHDAVECMIVTPLYPHRPVQFHSLQFPILLPLASRIRIVAESLAKRPVRFVADGRSVESVAEVSLAHSGLRVNLLREPHYNFVEALVRKIIGLRNQLIDERMPERE